MDDLISRAAALYAIDGLLSGNPKQEAMDAICDLEADSPLGAVAMRDAASRLAMQWVEGDCICPRCIDATHVAVVIAALPTPDHAAQLAAALKLPEVAALVRAGNLLSVCAQTTGGTGGRDDALVGAVDRYAAALAALEGKP